MGTKAQPQQGITQRTRSAILKGGARVRHIVLVQEAFPAMSRPEQLHHTGLCYGQEAMLAKTSLYERLADSAVGIATNVFGRSQHKQSTAG